MHGDLVAGGLTHILEGLSLNYIVEKDAWWYGWKKDSFKQLKTSAKPPHIIDIYTHVYIL